MRLLAALSVLPVLSGPLPAAADIWRSCWASITVSTAHPEALKELEVLALLEGRGPCRNRLHADRCRERARVEIDECLAILWSRHRFDAELPCQCRDRGTHRSQEPRGVAFQWEGIRLYPPPRSLFRETVHEACCRMVPNGGMVTVHLGGLILGDQGCAMSHGPCTQSEFTLEAKFSIDCPHWRNARRICDRP
ncbi:MAG: hypothetical protein N2Z62_02010 [Rhodobacteraceae bacterium]|nr:hypothetical protein [Paracoccaceae bacterium]